jgi:hypothetical protein
VPGGVVIGLARLNRVLDIDIPNLRVTLEPGVTNLEVTRQVAPFGYYYAPDPSSQQVCSLGGNVAENSGGAHCLKYGFTVHHFLAVEAVMPDGELVEIEYRDLQIVTDPEGALVEGAPQLSDEVPGNLAWEHEVGDERPSKPLSPTRTMSRAPKSYRPAWRRTPWSPAPAPSATMLRRRPIAFTHPCRASPRCAGSCRTTPRCRRTSSYSRSATSAAASASARAPIRNMRHS